MDVSSIVPLCKGRGAGLYGVCSIPDARSTLVVRVLDFHALKVIRDPKIDEEVTAPS